MQHPIIQTSTPPTFCRVCTPYSFSKYWPIFKILSLALFRKFAIKWSLNISPNLNRILMSVNIWWKVVTKTWWRSVLFWLLMKWLRVNFATKSVTRKLKWRSYCVVKTVWSFRQNARVWPTDRRTDTAELTHVIAVEATTYTVLTMVSRRKGKIYYTSFPVASP